MKNVLQGKIISSTKNCNEIVKQKKTKFHVLVFFSVKTHLKFKTIYKSPVLKR